MLRIGEGTPEDLPPAERLATVAIENPVLRRRHLFTRFALRRVLSGILGVRPAAIRISRSEFGKPFVEGADALHFSLSHSADWLAIVVGNVPVGIDIETRMPRNPLALAQRFYSHADFRRLESLPPHEHASAFLRQWVAKEAALKAKGCGIAGALSETECKYHDGKITEVRCRDGHFAIHEFDFAGGLPGAISSAGNHRLEIEWRDTLEAQR